MYAALSWVPRGAAKEKLPKGVDEGGDTEITNAEELQSKPSAATATGEMETEKEPGSDEEVDIAQVLANELNTLSFHKRNEKDPYLAEDPKASELFDDDELDDLIIRPTDALIVAAKSGDDACTLEVHLFDDDPDASDTEDGPYEPHTYVHHDIVLPVFPLCTAYTRLNIENEALNLVAVGMFTPGIDVWDIDRMNDLEPVVSLGGYERKENLTGAMAAAAAATSHNRSKKKKKPKLRLKQDSHKDAVMSLSWNNVQREYLASGSADNTVKIWDIESSHCACTLEHHSDKVQSVAFHPSTAEKLLTGSFDRTICLVDVRDRAKNLSWSVEADVESCQWVCSPTVEYIFATTEDGYMTVFDPRKSMQTTSNGYLCRWRAHMGAATSFSVSSEIPGMLVSGGVDKLVKVWDLSTISSGKAAELVYQKPSRAGALFTLSLCPISGEDSNASPFVIAFGGAKGSLLISDLAVESDEVRKRFLQHCPTAASEAIMKRAARQKQTAGLKAPSMASEESDEGEDFDSNHGEGWQSE